MSRVRTSEAYVQQKVSLPATLVARFSMLHWDPVASKTQYGKISEVFTKLLTDYVNKMEHGIDPLGDSASPAAPLSEPPLEKL